MTDVAPAFGGYVLALLGGLAGSLHCVGMCGAFPLAIASAAPRRSVTRQVLYQVGRVNALLFIGAVSGALGATLVAFGPVAAGARALAVVAGVVMVTLGLEMLGFTAGATSRLAFAINSVLAGPLRGALASPSLAAPLGLGALNAFLPCHLVYAFAAQAAISGTALRGLLTMLAFGLGTVPALLGLGLFGGRVSPRLRLTLDRLVGGALVAYGVIVASRAFLQVATDHMH